MKFTAINTYSKGVGVIYQVKNEQKEKRGT